MAATYSSFMTTRFYSPVFNTALFDGPVRIYFSQTYESAALKIYHLLQTQYHDLWGQLKEHTLRSREHVFIMIYPEKKDLQVLFTEAPGLVQAQEWEEGLALGMCQPQNDLELVEQLETMTRRIQGWVGHATHEITT